jgi:shikimate kinase
MASGKSTVGRLIAERTGRRFVDLDRLVEERAGTSIPEIFRLEGEPGFRAREREALLDVLDDDGVVLATGGGAASREDNLSDMLARGFVVALDIAAEEVIRRVGRTSGRPMLDRAADPLAVARELIAAREPFYARAHARVDTVGKTAARVAHEVQAIWEGEQSR